MHVHHSKSMAGLTQTIHIMPDGEVVTDYRDAAGLLVRVVSNRREEWFEKYWQENSPNGYWWYRRHRELPLPAVEYKNGREPVYYTHGDRCDKSGTLYSKPEKWHDGKAQH